MSIIIGYYLIACITSYSIDEGYPPEVALQKVVAQLSSSQKYTHSDYTI